MNTEELESIRFCDKIEMHKTNSYKFIPKLDLTMFSNLNKVYYDHSLIDDDNNKIKKKKLKKNNSVSSFFFN